MQATPPGNFSLSAQRVQENTRQLQPAGLVLEPGQRLADPVLALVGDEEGRAWQQRELQRQEAAREGAPRRLDHHTFGIFQHEGVVHGSDARPDIVQRVAGICTPRAGRDEEPQPAPAVDRNGAIPQLGEDFFETLFPDLPDRY